MNDTAPSAVPAYIGSLVRNALVLVSGYIIGKGWLTSDQANAFTGAALAALPIVWSLVQKHNANKALKSAIAAPAGKAA